MALSSNSRLHATAPKDAAPQGTPPSVGADEISQLLDALNTADAKTHKDGVPVVAIPDGTEKDIAAKKTTGNLRLTGNIQPQAEELPPPPAPPAPPAPPPAPPPASPAPPPASPEKAPGISGTTGFVLPELEHVVTFEEGTAKPRKGKEWVPGDKKKGKVKAPPRERTQASEWTTGSVVYLIVVLLLVAAYAFFYVIRPRGKDSGAIAKAAPSAMRAKTSSSAAKSVLKTATETIEAAKAAATAASSAVADAVGDMTKKIVPLASKEEKGPAAKETVAEEPPIVIPDSKYLPPWMKKDDGGGETKKEIVIKVPEVVDSPEVKEWPELKVSAVLAGGARGGALVNGNVVSVGEATAEGPVLKSVSKQSAVFEWDGDTRTFFINAKP